MKVAIVGGGYSGVWAYRALNRWLGKKAEITVISDYDFHNFHGFVGDVLDGFMPSNLIESPLQECFPKAKRVLGKVSHVDVSSSTLTVVTDEGEQKLFYDQLLVATGAKENTDRIPGLAEHAWLLRTPRSTGKLYAHILEVLAKVDAKTHNHEDNNIVVIGGGFTGTEVAAAVGRLIKGRGKVTLVASSERVIPSWSRIDILHKNLLRNLEVAGVLVQTSKRVKEVTGESVVFADGTAIPASIVIGAPGNIPVILPGLENFTEKETGLLKVSRGLQLTENIWAAGDVAGARDKNGNLLHKDALWAIGAGTRAGRNIARAHRGAKPRPFSFLPIGGAATFAPGQSVGRLLGLPINGLFAYLMRQGLFLWFVPSRRSAGRILHHISIGKLKTRFSSGGVEDVVSLVD
jgi:NADH dehydrogenase